MTSLRVSICAAAALFGLAAATPGYCVEVGSAAAVNPVSKGTPPGSGARDLQSGTEVFFKERIHTETSGSLQVLFVDRSMLGVGPGTDVTLDAFVYDPNAGTSQSVLSVTKGSFRFLTGRTGNGATIRTPSVTIGIRG